MPVYSGFVAALLFGAALTTFNAGLNSSSTLFVLNVYKPWSVKKNLTIPEPGYVRVAKRFEIVICLIAMLIAPFIIFASNGFYTYVQTVGGLFSVPIFTILLVGFLTKRVPPVAAKTGLCFFIVCYGITQLFIDVHIHFLHVLAILFILTTALMLLIGKYKPLAIPYKPQKAGPVDVSPWKRRHWFSIVLLLMVILLYLIFSPLGLVK